jgi:hypothetical protein
VKHETEWVDRVEFRLSVGGQVCVARRVVTSRDHRDPTILRWFPIQMWAEWVVRGDTHYNNGDTCTIDCPLFTTQIQGGWFAKTCYITTTKPGLDPALALLIAHLCYTEYSVAEIKGDLRPNTPMSPPRTFMYQPPMQQALFYSGAPLDGQFQWGGLQLAY